jgi:PIN domain nuclease of toxin-antitoxin system
MLLDTNVVLWSMQGVRVGPEALARLTTASVRYVSAVSRFELTIKEMLGKLTLPADLTSSLQAMGLDTLPFDERHAAAVSEFPELARHDPFDRMLVAQARAEGIPFLTGDRRLLSLSLPWIIDASA